ncbi:MAG: thioesterase domain-containing protein, partial [Geminicoccaceae bacterium]
PDAMVPAAITTVPTLPRLPNGKIDRNALIPIANAEVSQATEHRYTAPTTPTERLLVEIWQKVLKVQKVGIRDDFFALGGDSLCSIRIVSLARREGLDVKPTSVLEFPTIEALLRSMEAPPKPRAGDETTSKRPFFLVQGGERMRDYLQEALADQCTVHLMDDHWNDGFLSPVNSVDRMAEDYFGQLKAISQKGPYLLGGFSIGAAAAVVMAKRLMEAGEDVEILFLLDPPDNLAFIGGVEGLDKETLDALSMEQASDEDPFGRPKVEVHGRFAWIARASDFIVRKYYRYMRGPFRLAQGSLAFYLGRKLPPHAAAHYAWIVYNFAIQRHKLSPYAGRLLVFRSLLGRDLGQHYLWEKLARGPYEEEHFHCEHISFRRDPAIVKAWTQRLAAKLRELT